jgi:hypothetical protein
MSYHQFLLFERFVTAAFGMRGIGSAMVTIALSARLRGITAGAAHAKIHADQDDAAEPQSVPEPEPAR